MFSCGWLWLYFGAFLMFAELLAPGFVLFFFGLSAATVGACRLLIGEAFSTSWQLATFSVFSLVYLLLLRRWMKGLFSGFTSTSVTKFGHESAGRIGKVVKAIDPPIKGRVLIGDAEWDAIADTAIGEGVDVRVIESENLTMRVEAV